MKKNFFEKFNELFYIAPALIFMIFLTLIPNFYSLYIAFTNYSLYHFQKFEWVGLRNFIRILTGDEMKVFGKVAVWNIAYAFISVIGMMVIGLILALLLNRDDVKFRNFYRTGFIIPWAIPAFISVLMWQGMLNSDVGSINQILTSIGIKGLPWLEDAFWARTATLIVNIWLGFPFFMTACLGALQSIPNELYEAASVDGATSYRKFTAITLPLLRSALIPIFITSFAFNFNQFNSIYLLTGGGPPVLGSAAGATDILVTYSYKLAFNLFNFGMACAYAVFIFIVIASISSINFKITGAFHER